MSAVFGIAGPDASSRDGLLADMHKAVHFRGSKLCARREGALVAAACHGSEAAGPFVVTNAPGTVVAVCEGELYNGTELGRAIDAARPWPGFSVVPELYDRLGTNFPRHMNGAFAIALVDRTTRTLDLVRDHAGSHSIFFAAAGATTVFATTIQSLIASGLVPARLSKDAVDDTWPAWPCLPPRPSSRT